MIAHFYLLAESFCNNRNLNNAELEEKIKRLAEDVRLINQYSDTNIIYTNYSDLYPQIFYSTYTVCDFICNPQRLKEEGVDRDVINSLNSIIQKSRETTCTSIEVVDNLLSWIDEDNCHGLISFHKINQLDENLQIIYGIDGWYKFRRYFLGKYPKNENFFIDECIKYFPVLYFHERNRLSIRVIFNDCPKKIIYHLAALNDKLRDARLEGLNRTELLRQFSIIACLDEEASPEGDASRKIAFTFKFTNEEGIEEDVCCEPHLKLCYSDISNSYSNNRRIYFHEGKFNIKKGRILIGHIGGHL